MGRVTCERIFWLFVATIAASACNTHPVQYQPEDAESHPLSAEEIKESETVVMPWSHVVGSDDVEEMTVEPDRLIFHGGSAERAAEQYRPLDIVVSEVREQPFLRRVTGVRREGSNVVVRTERARITDALFKGGYETGGDAGGTRKNKGRLRQALGGDYRPLPAGSSISFDGVGIHDPQLSGSADPVFELSPRMHLDFEVEPGNLTKRPSNWMYEGVRSCTSDSDCHRGETCSGGTCSFDASGGGDLNAQIDPRPWDDDQHTCAQLVQILRRLRKDDSCRRQWEDYWAEGGRGSRADAACPVYRPGLGGKKKIGELKPPYLAQVEWAKKTCRGTLESFEFDFRADVRLALKNLSISGSSSGWAGDSIKDLPDLRFGPYLVTVGWLPVLITPEYDPSLDYWFGLGSSGDVELAKPVGMKEPITLGGGVHYYADRERRSQGEFDRGMPTGEWHPNEPPKPGTELYPMEVQGQSDVSASATVTLEHSLNLLLYETAGPLVQFRAPILTTAIQGGVAGGPTADGGGPSLCTLGAKLGITAKAGITAQMPFCEECARGALKWTVWDSCGSGYCGAPNNALACEKVCFSNDCDSGGAQKTESACSDGIDNDGDGAVDCDDSDCSATSACDQNQNGDGGGGDGCASGTEYTCYVDGDGDGYGGRKAGTYCRSCLRVGGAVGNNDDCDDSDADVHPGADEKCTSSTDYDCDGAPQCGDDECGGQKCGGRWCRVCISGTCKCP